MWIRKAFAANKLKTLRGPKFAPMAVWCTLKTPNVDASGSTCTTITANWPMHTTMENQPRKFRIGYTGQRWNLSAKLKLRTRQAPNLIWYVSYTLTICFVSQSFVFFVHQKTDDESPPRTENSDYSKPKRMKRSESSMSELMSTSAATHPVAIQKQTNLAEDQIDTTATTLLEGENHPHLAASKEWAIVLNQMLPMYATRAKFEIKAILSKYWRISVCLKVAIVSSVPHLIQLIIFAPGRIRARSFR